MSIFSKPYLFLFCLICLQSLLNIAHSEEQTSNAETTQNTTNTEKSKDKPKKSTQNSALPVPKPVTVGQQYKTDLAHYLPAAQVKPILVGTEEFITLIDESTSANNKGVAILIPDWQQGAVNPKAINFLRQALPEQGWTTISVQPNNIPDNFPSTALKLSAQKEENKALLADYNTLFSAMINAVSKKANEYPGIVIMIAQGNNGALLLESFAENSANSNQAAPNAVILLSSYVLTGEKLLDQRNTAFAKALANSELPVLDLYLKHDNAIVKDKAPQRLATAKQAMKVYYRQRQLNNSATGFYPQQELLSQLNSWLKSIGW